MKKIYNFEELCKLEPSKTHYIEKYYSDEDGIYSAWIESFDKTERDGHYLSTHTFYGGKTTKEYNKLLIECGFDVELIPYKQIS